MVRTRLRVRWAVLRTFGAWGRVIAETPFDEPVIALAGDRFVLRQTDHQFWTAATCPSCAVNTASVDLPAHQEVCLRPAAVLHTASAPRPAAVLHTASAPRPAAVTNADGPTRTRRGVTLLSRLPARAFGQRHATPADLLVLAMAMVAAVVVFVVVLRSSL